MTKITHTVVLNILPDSYYWSLFAEIGNSILLEDGKPVICLFCSEIDSLLPNYLYAVVHKSANVADINASMGMGLGTSIPHNLVLLIDHSLFVQKHIGFQS